MRSVHFTIFTTQWELYNSQWLPPNANCTLYNGYHTIVTVHITMVTHKGSSTLQNGYNTINLDTSLWLNTMGTVHFTMVTHNGKSTFLSGHPINETAHFTVVTTKQELYTSQ